MMKLFNKSIQCIVILYGVIFGCQTLWSSPVKNNFTESKVQLGTQEVIGNKVAIASRSELASNVGVSIYRSGGNVVDMAVGVGFALAVTYPSAGNLAGGGFMLIHFSDGQVIVNDHREESPENVKMSLFLDDNNKFDSKKSKFSGLSVGVPGTVSGLLEALDRYGNLSRQAVMKYAIQLASEGFILSEELSEQFSEKWSNFSEYPASMKKFSCTDDNAPCQQGDLWVQKELAEVLKLISQKGAKGFYEGEVAERIVNYVQSKGGVLTLKDLKAYRSIWREPIHFNYRDYEIISVPLPSSGGILLTEMFNMIEPYPVKKMGYLSPELLHLMVEIKRRAYRDRFLYLGDAKFMKHPVDFLLSKAYAKESMLTYRPMEKTDISSKSKVIVKESPETTHVSILDHQGNSVSYTTTLNFSYGNRQVVPGTGILLNNEMDDFSYGSHQNAYGLIGGKANQLLPKKRMLSSMSPTIVKQNDEPILVLGTPGGSGIITTIFQVLLNVLDHQMSLKDAITSARFHHQWYPDIIYYEGENKVLENALKSLLEFDYVMKDWKGSRLSGDVQAVQRISEGLYGISDFRYDGMPAAL